MTLTVKLDRDLEQALARRCAERGLPKSVVVKRALAEYLAKGPLIALFNRDDAWHDPVVKFLRKHPGLRLLTTWAVLISRMR